MRIFLVVSLLALVGCGLNARLDEFDVAKQESMERISIFSQDGINAGEILLTKGKCEEITYSLVNSYGGIFEISPSGQITMAMNNPPEGNYDLVVKVGCDGQSKTLTFPIKIEAPWIIQLGMDTEIPFANADKTQFDNCWGMAIDGDGNIYCGGQTRGSLGETHAGGGDAYVMKIAPNKTILWITQLGQSTKYMAAPDHTRTDKITDLLLDYEGNIVVSGETARSIGETQASNRRDGFLMKLDKNGVITWVRQFGKFSKYFNHTQTNKHHDFCMGVGVDKQNNVYCSGRTRSHFAEMNGGIWDVFIAKVNKDGVLDWATQLGQSTKDNFPGVSNAANDGCRRMTIDNSGNAICGGYTHGSLGEIHSGGSNRDLMVMKLNSLGGLEWVFQLGATTRKQNFTSAVHTADDEASVVITDAKGNIYFAGHTKGSLGEGNGGGNDAVVGKLDSDGNLLWLEQFGDETSVVSGGDNSGDEMIYGINIRGNHIFVVGSTNGDFIEPNGGGTDGFVIKMSTANGDVAWGRQFGAKSKTTTTSDSSGNDIVEDVTFDKKGRVYLSGQTGSDLGDRNSGDQDIFVVRLNPDGSL